MDDIVFTGTDHEDFGNNGCKDGRSRTWMILLYEDDPTHKSVLDGKLSDLDWNYAGIKHDQDGVKAHHHIVVLFKDGRKCADVAKDLGIDVRWLRAWDRAKKALRYLCHRDDASKYQYSTDAIYGTIAEKAVSVCSKGEPLSENASVQEIISLLDGVEGYVSYKFFISLVAEQGCYATFRRMGVLGTRLIDEHNYNYSKKLSKERGEEFERLTALKGFENFTQMPFADRISVIEKAYGDDISAL